MNAYNLMLAITVVLVYRNIRLRSQLKRMAAKLNGSDVLVRLEGGAEIEAEATLADDGSVDRVCFHAHGGKLYAGDPVTKHRFPIGQYQVPEPNEFLEEHDGTKTAFDRLM